MKYIQYQFLARKRIILYAETQDTACFEYLLMNTAELSTEHFSNLATRIFNTQHSTLNDTLLNCKLLLMLAPSWSVHLTAVVHRSTNLSCYSSSTEHRVKVMLRLASPRPVKF